MMFEKILFREITVAAVITALYGIAGLGMEEPTTVFCLFAMGMFLQEWIIEKWRGKQIAKANRTTGRKYAARRTA